MNPIRNALVGASFVIAAAGPAAAHHSFAMFDRAREIEVKGTVYEFQYSSPHVWLWIMSKDPSGAITKWGFEGEAPSVLIRKGVKPNTIKPGDLVTVRTNPMKDGRTAGFLLSVTKADGTVLDPRNQAADVVQ
jgi:hypothetical protein